MFMHWNWAFPLYGDRSHGVELHLRSEEQNYYHSPLFSFYWTYYQKFPQRDSMLEPKRLLAFAYFQYSFSFFSFKVMHPGIQGQMDQNHRWDLAKSRWILSTQETNKESKCKSKPKPEVFYSMIRGGDPKGELHIYRKEGGTILSLLGFYLLE